MAKRIELFREPKGWMARFVDDAAIFEDFGTDTIPTAFTANAPSAAVLAAIADRNPGTEVVLKPTYLWTTVES